MKKQSKLGNPLDTSSTIIEKSAEVIPFLIKFAVFAGVGYWAYSSYTNRFIKRKENATYPDAKISFAQAQARANAIYSSIGVFSNDFANVSRQLSNLNYNDFIRVYNAFGHKTGTLLGGDLDLEQWCANQFTRYEVQQLSFLLGGAFFQ